MKRHRTETDTPDSCDIERKVTKLRRRSDSVSSSHVRGRHSSGGVVKAATVTAAATPTSSSSTHQPPAFSTSQTHADHHQGRTTLRKPPHSTSTMLPKLVKEALVSGSAEQLFEHIDNKFVSTMPSSETWTEECESLVAASFVSLVWEKSGTWRTRLELLIQDFCERWHENGNIQDLITDCTELQKSSLLGCLILLVDILECSNLEVKMLHECSKWPSREAPPRWLSDICGTKCGSYSEINNLLYAVSLMLKGQNVNLKYENSYTGSLLCFLIANQFYKNGQYNESLKTLNCSRENQGDDLSGWIHWLSGINLLHIGKYHTALLKLQDAVESSNLCTRALFTVSQLFHSMDQKAAELETLSLLAVADHDVEIRNHNIQSCLLERLHPRSGQVNEVAIFLLAARCLQQKMYKDASKKFNELMNKIDHHSINKSPTRTLLRPEDDIPPMPEHLCLNILAGLAEYKNGNYKEAINLIGSIISIESVKFFESGPKEKVICFSVVCGHFLRIKSFMDMNHLKEALAICNELENMMSWSPGNECIGWSQILLVSKCALYKTATVLHKRLQHYRNAAHYQRLAAQCCGSLTAEKSKISIKYLIGTEEWMSLSLCYQIIIENMNDFFTDLADLTKE